MRIVHAVKWVIPTLFATLLMAATLSIPTWLSVQFIVSLLALWSLSYSIESMCDELGMTRFVTVFVVPYLTTMPELVSTYYLVAAGHILAGALTFVGSAIFDLFLVLPLLARGLVLDRTFLMLVGTSLPLPLAALVLGGVLHSRVLGTVLLVLGTGVTLVVAVYGTHRLVAPQTKSTAELIANIITLMSSIVAFTYTCISYSSIVTAMCRYIPETLAGILNAYMTSLPDAIYAEVAREAGKIDEAVGELWSCVVHDYTVVPGFALALGGALTFTMRDIAYMLAVPITFAILLSLSRMEIDRRTMLTMFVLFIVFTVLGLLL